jgi:hypothetical protein
MLHHKAVSAIELSALRQNELRPMVEALDELDLSQFEYISLHAPSQFPRDDEEKIVGLLYGVCARGWPVILHPDAIHEYAPWRSLGKMLYVENMDKRKPIGRTVSELESVFDRLPEAAFCFDIGHARQIDSTMTEAYLMLKRFRDRLRQVHVSEVNTRSKHDPLSYASILAFQEVGGMIPEDIPVILETPVPEDQIEFEMERAREALPVVQHELVGR